ncbi:MAG: hypothetical protein HY901_22905 [Deltaproteobacteria bacterium]|nr:hypothetical protein [Deltaproteobacteria bacterium]
MVSRTWLVLLGSWMAGSGCATTLSTFDTARPTPVKHVRLNVGYGLHLPVGSMVKGVVAAGEAVAESIEKERATLSEEQAEKLYEACVATALTPPSTQWEIMARTGLFRDMDVGLRYSTNALRLDLKYRFFHMGVDDEGKSHHLSIGLSGAYYLFSNPLFEILDYIQLADFSRWDLEVPLLYSWEYRRYFALYLGAKYMYTSFELDSNLHRIQQYVTRLAEMPPITDQISSSMHYFGGVLGLGGGYKWVFVYTELSMGYTRLRPRLYSFVDGATQERNMDGFAVYPAVGLVVKI